VWGAPGQARRLPNPRGVYDRGFRFRWTPPSKQERTAVGAIAPPVTFLSENVIVSER